MKLRGKFGAVVCAVQISFILIYAFRVDYDVDADASDPVHWKGNNTDPQNLKENSLKTYYGIFQDVHAMIFFGIGFLYTFLQKYGYSGASMNMLLAAISIQWAIITQNFWNFRDGKIHIDIVSLIKGDFASASVLIAFGGIFGKVSPLQMVIFTLLEIVIYTTNEYYCLTVFQVVDVGGSVSLHLFAALFGLSVAFVVDKNKKVTGNPNESTTYVSNLFCFLGTVFLWAFWPGFNSALVQGDSQHRSAINTYLALLASCVTTFATSSFMNKGDKFNMVHIQNATLAGGVAIGAVTSLMIHPFGALIVGGIGGSLSVLGYTYVTPFLTNYMKLYDPCGINSLHIIPGTFSGLLAAISALFASTENYGLSLYETYPAMAPSANTTQFEIISSQLSTLEAGISRTSLKQAGFQIVYMGVTIVVAVVSGLITGIILRQPIFDPLESEDMYLDEVFWEMPKEQKKEIITAANNNTAITKF